MQDPADTTISPALAACGVTKRFGGATVLHAVDFAIATGEVVSLVGENGAGKSTLMKILAGVHTPSEGHVEIGGSMVELDSPLRARRHGVVLIHQEPQSFPQLSIAENVHFASNRGELARLVSWPAIRRKAREALERLGLSIDEDRPMEGLSIADQQMVEIACALAADGRVIIMDEPTAALTPAESERLLSIIADLRRQGRSIVYISHRLAEVRAISDRIVVLRDGVVAGGGPASRFASEDDIVRLMIGRDIAPPEMRPASAPRPVLLEVERLSQPGRFSDVSFNLRAGEILGLAGLVGAGRTDVAEALFGVTPARSGRVRVGGKDVVIANPQDAIAAGLALTPEDRAKHGIFAELPVAQNMVAGIEGRNARAGLLSSRKERVMVQDAIARFGVRLHSPEQAIDTLSGGNQQKVVLARSLLREPRILLLDEPTRGVDIGKKAEVHRLIRDLADQGRGVLLISSDMTELLALSDRVLVMSAGRVTAELSREAADEETIMRHAIAGLSGGASA